MTGEPAPGDPVPFGPASWGWTEYLGLAVSLALFLAFVLLVVRLGAGSEEETLPED